MWWPVPLTLLPLTVLGFRAVTATLLCFLSMPSFLWLSPSSFLLSLPLAYFVYHWDPSWAHPSLSLRPWLSSVLHSFLYFFSLFTSFPLLLASCLLPALLATQLGLGGFAPHLRHTVSTSLTDQGQRSKGHTHTKGNKTQASQEGSGGSYHLVLKAIQGRLAP